MSGNGDPGLSELLASLYRGIAAEPPWEAFLESLAGWLDADFATLIIAAKGKRLPGTFVSPGADPQRSAEYVERFFADDPFRDLPNDQVTSFAGFLAGQDSRRMAAYREYLTLAGGEQVLAVDMVFPSQFEARFRLTRLRDKPDFTRAERDRLQALVPHLRTAVGLFERLQFAEAEHEVFRSATDALGFALLVLDPQLRLISGNALGRQVLDEAEGLRQAGGKVRFDAPEAARRIERLFQGGPDHGPARFRIARPEHGDLIVTARPIDLPAIHSGAGAMALFLTRPGSERLLEPEAIRELLGVTLAEARLCAALGQGRTLDEAARDLGIARNTAKVQLRSIFVKTQVNRQAQLVNLLGALTG